MVLLGAGVATLVKTDLTRGESLTPIYIAYATLYSSLPTAQVQQGSWNQLFAEPFHLYFVVNPLGSKTFQPLKHAWTILAKKNYINTLKSLITKAYINCVFHVAKWNHLLSTIHSLLNAAMYKWVPELALPICTQGHIHQLTYDQ